MLPPTKTVAPLRFDDLDGKQFERLTFAYHIRTEPAYGFEWYGQVGKDGGRDVVGIGQLSENKGRSFLIACANWRDFTFAKAKKDISQCAKSPHGVPDRVRFVTGSSSITASVRDQVKAHCRNLGIYECEVWAATDFEEHLRAKTQSLLRRIFEGEVFPDNVADLVQVSRSTPPANDAEVLALLARAFDRPAFQDPIHQESSLQAFRQAIEDSISVLNTGVWKTREGVVIATLPSKHEVRSSTVLQSLNEVVRSLRSLRTMFDTALRSGNLRPCDCGQPDCPTYLMTPGVAQRLEAQREAALTFLRQAETEAEAIRHI